MKWNNVIANIKENIVKRKLKSPEIRFRALQRIDNLFRLNFPRITKYPYDLISIPKKDIILRAENIFSRKFNAPELSIVNQIYRFIHSHRTEPVFYVRDNLKITSSKEFPCFILKKNDWDDFGYHTTFELYFLRSKNDSIFIGNVKILQRGKEKTVLPLRFISLDSTLFCSLGQSIEYYYLLKNLKQEIDIGNILDVINDIAYNMGLRTGFEKEDGYKNSLIRYSEAEKALLEGKKIVDGIPYKNTFNFTFSSKLPNAEKEHLVNFHFSQDVLQKLNRIIALVGKNGTGKTQILARLANTLSGNLKDGNIISEYRPPFSKVIAVAYSLFDRFTIPSTSKSFSYVYCGMREATGRIIEKNLLKKFQLAVNRIIEKNRHGFYFRLLNNVIDENVLNIVFNDSCEIQNDFINKVLKQKISLLSSGQSIYIYILSEIIANIEMESLLLFDEPETHLHPNAIAKMTNSIYEILSKFDSYAVIGTHSPIIIQQIPSRYVLVFERQGNLPIIRQLGLESFGESLTNITEDIFETINVEENYKKEFEKMTKEYTYKEVMNIFEEKLSLNAKIFLKQLYTK